MTVGAIGGSGARRLKSSLFCLSGLLGHNSNMWGVLVGKVGTFCPRRGGIGIRSHSIPSSEGVHACGPVAFM